MGRGRPFRTWSAIIVVHIVLLGELVFHVRAVEVYCGGRDSPDSIAVPTRVVYEGEDSFCTAADFNPSNVGAKVRYGHRWPTGYGVTDCHGWEYFDKTSHLKVLNSANNITCIDSNTFSYNLFPGSLTCNSNKGGPVKNVITANKCTQGDPPTFFSLMPVQECSSIYTDTVTFMTSAASWGQTYKNGDKCKNGLALNSTAAIPNIFSFTTSMLLLLVCSHLRDG